MPAAQWERKHIQSLRIELEDGLMIRQPSDVIEPNSIYIFDGAVQADVKLSGYGSIATDMDVVVINGNLETAYFSPKI